MAFVRFSLGADSKRIGKWTLRDLRREKEKMSILKWVRDIALRMVFGGDRADLLADNRFLRNQIAGLERVNQETYQQGKEAIISLRAKLKFHKQAALVFEKRISELEQQLAEVSERSLTDPLTELLNRRGASGQLIATASTLWHSVGSTEKPINKRLPCSIVFIDLDNFKPVNDRYGHAKGDEALKIVTRLLQQSFPRKGDIIFRFGGDEFGVIMAHAHIDTAEKRSTEFLQRMSSEQGLWFDGTHVSASIGISSMLLSPTQGGLKPEVVMLQLERAIEEADAAMYLSKESGKGTVTIHQ